MNVPVDLDLTRVGALPALHDELARLFGFPGFYGGNYPALVDCLSSLRFPEDGMTSVTLASESDVILLRVKGLSRTAREIASTLLSAIEAVNDRLVRRGLDPSIHVLLLW